MRLGMVGAALLCCLVGTADAQAATPKCLTGGTTLVSSSTARIFVTERTFPDHTVATWWACDLGRGRPHVLAMGGMDPNQRTKGIFKPALNGRFVAYQAGVEAPGYGCTGDLVVYDMRRGAVLRSARFGGGSVCASRIVVSARGSAAVAWDEEFGGAGVAALDSPHGPRTVDRVTDGSIDTSSLTLTGPTTITWRHGGATRTAALR
jgi:hypothetical protein